MDASIATSLWKEGKDASAENSYWVQVQFYFTTLSFTLLKNLAEKACSLQLLITCGHILDKVWKHRLYLHRGGLVVKQ